MKMRGFRLGKRLSRWIARRTRKPSRGYHPLSKLISWARHFSNRTKSLCSRKIIGSGYEPLREDQPKPKVPKGHLAVYVGQEDGAYYRVLVPVIYFNHPLFGQLLKEAEDEYGFDHQGGITIPCRISDFETLQTKIAAAPRQY